MKRAKKHLGQHFLKSKRALDAIVAAGEVKGGETVLEIGPGTGVLTERLLAAGAHVVAVEKDAELVEFLREKFAGEIGEKRLTLARGDILSFEIPGVSYKLIANIPYYITGQIIEKFLTASRQPERMVLLIQKEVAQRITAKDGKESVLSLSVKAYGTPKIVRQVSRREFNPAPKVASAVLLITDISRKHFDSVDEGTFFEVVKAGFAHPRKKLASNLAALLEKDSIARLFAERGIGENARAEDLALEDWLWLAQNADVPTLRMAPCA